MHKYFIVYEMQKLSSHHNKNSVVGNTFATTKNELDTEESIRECRDELQKQFNADKLAIHWWKKINK